MDGAGNGVVVRVLSQYDADSGAMVVAKFLEGERCVGDGHVELTASVIQILERELCLLDSQIHAIPNQLARIGGQSVAIDDAAILELDAGGIDDIEKLFCRAAFEETRPAI